MIEGYAHQKHDAGDHGKGQYDQLEQELLSSRFVRGQDLRHLRLTGLAGFSKSEAFQASVRENEVVSGSRMIYIIMHNHRHR